VPSRIFNHRSVYSYIQQYPQLQKKNSISYAHAGGGNGYCNCNFCPGSSKTMNKASYSHSERQQQQQHHGLTPPIWFWGVVSFGVISSSTSLLLWSWKNYCIPLTTPSDGQVLQEEETVQSSSTPIYYTTTVIARLTSSIASFQWKWFSNTIRRSLQEDYPLWLASLWVLWKLDEPRNQQRWILTDSSTATTRALMHHHAGNPSENSTSTRLTFEDSDIVGGTVIPNYTTWVSFTRDLLLLGLLLMYKKSKEKHIQQKQDKDGTPYDNNSGDKDEETTSVAKDDENTSTKAAVDEIRRILTQSGNDHSITAAMHQQNHPQHLHSLPSAPTSTKTQQRYIEILVHNVSHTDLILSLDAPPVSRPTTDAALDSTSATDGPGTRNQGTTTVATPPPKRHQFETGEDIHDDEQYCLCRPRFSAFDAYSQRIVDFVDRRESRDHVVVETKSEDSADSSSVITPDAIISFPRHERSDENQSYRVKTAPSQLKDMIPIGFRLQDEITSSSSPSSLLQVSDTEIHDLRVRGRDACRVIQSTISALPNARSSTNNQVKSNLSINAVFFPLLATLLPLWQAKMKEKYGGDRDTSNSVKQVLFLVSGVGTPRNWTHSITGNSTQQCARLMKFFLQILYPNLVVVHIHSETNIFRYDENIAFVQQELLPRIQGYRDAHAKGLPYPDEEPTARPPSSTGTGHPLGPSPLSSTDDIPFSSEWRKSFSLAISFADGSPARTFAIQAALRPFKPTFFHFWQLKTFWHESKIVESDIEIHSFEEMETLPPVETSQLQDRPVVLQVVEEMKRFRDDMIRILSASSNSNDIRSFWLRKTQKPVLAVLAVHVGGGRMKLYRGTNMEVSMPTGSLCAERNVIGTALADNPSLKRQNLKLIAVLAVPSPESWNSRGAAGVALPRQPSTLSLASLPTTTNQDDFPPNTSSTGWTAGRNPVTISEVFLNSSGSSLKPSLIPSRKSSIGDDDEWIFQDPNAAAAATAPWAAESAMTHLATHHSKTATNSLTFASTVKNSPHVEPTGSGSSTPARRIPLYKPHHKAKQEPKLMVVVHSHVVRIIS
jgi:hypothetical protein